MQRFRLKSCRQTSADILQKSTCRILWRSWMNFCMRISGELSTKLSMHSCMVFVRPYFGQNSACRIQPSRNIRSIVFASSRLIHVVRKIPQSSGRNSACIILQRVSPTVFDNPKSYNLFTLSHKCPRSFCTFQFRFGFVALSGFLLLT